MADLAELRALEGRAREIALGMARKWANELDDLPRGDWDEEAAIRAMLDAVGDMTIALLPRVEC